MQKLIKAKEPFRFCSRFHLSELTGLKATNIEELLELIKTVPGSSIYHHTHRFLQQHQYLSPEPPNDFAYWIREVLGEDELGERLASIDIMEFPAIRSLREKIISIIENYLREKPKVKLKFSSIDEAFHFIKSRSFIILTDYIAYDLKEFVEILKKITIDSIYFHIFEARLRLEKKTNDFSWWIEDSLGNKKLALKISRLDPYTRTLEDLRKEIISIVEKEIT
jgi:septum formation topological specificity factor MinE